MMSADFGSWRWNESSLTDDGWNALLSADEDDADMKRSSIIDPIQYPLFGKL